MQLKIVTPEKVVLETEVDAVQAKAIDGEVGILKHHVPMITPLDIGILTYTQKGQTQQAAIMQGILKTDGQSVVVLADVAELAGDIDALRAQQAKERAETRLRNQDAHVDATRAEMAFSRSLVRLKLAGKA